MEDLIKALQIFLKYGNERNPTNCIHDELIVCGYHKEWFSDEDIVELEKLSFRWNDSEDYFYSYRFGSC